ncbi:alpha/beta hydrolase [Mangrovibrevibacter kandeliae]|uniref:alpha/beta hydrolase n=1 Tax=Mangrovibrevibacter kandeliae TaxID=2968473 RepID=UPI00211871C9|nr:alpha/beta hydrolase [Aurantimonas sp. CSK15Z-1]MCQ8782110.1 alpha/beta hydrolase [Aurantimonas sp. CSK15Z-1]
MDLDTIWTGGERLADYDTAYDNSGAIEGAAQFVPRWQADAKAFRSELAGAGRAELGLRYGDRPRQHYDLFLPEAAPVGLAVFIHGGYWKSQEIGNWSHFAAGALARGFAVALPEYTLCPDATIPEITREIGRFLDQVAGRFEGPINLSGHSAGGHLVSRMLCTDAQIAAETAARIERVVSISGCHDLRPIMLTGMNAALRLDRPTARAESPALLEPRAGIDLTCLVGGAELPEFRRQNALLANAWHGFGVTTRAIERPGRHHFDVVDDLIDPNSELVARLTGARPL